MFGMARYGAPFLASTGSSFILPIVAVCGTLILGLLYAGVQWVSDAGAAASELQRREEAAAETAAALERKTTILATIQRSEKRAWEIVTKAKDDLGKAQDRINNLAPDGGGRLCRIDCQLP